MSMTNSILLGVVSIVAGGAVGFLYFGGLWRTVQALTASDRPGLLFIGSFLARNALLVAAAIGIATIADWYHLSVFLIGLIISRFILVRSKRGAEDA